MSSKRNFLSLKDKLKVIQENKKGISARKLAVIFDCGKSQINEILKIEDYLESSFEA